MVTSYRDHFLAAIRHNTQSQSQSQYPFAYSLHFSASCIPFLNFISSVLSLSSLANLCLRVAVPCRAKATERRLVVMVALVNVTRSRLFSTPLVSSSLRCVDLSYLVWSRRDLDSKPEDVMPKALSLGRVRHFVRVRIHY